ncbi:MAG: SUMF1/EgtB/PvdO family nonheme iron enzyme [Chloroflexota bacterium]
MTKVWSLDIPLNIDILPAFDSLLSPPITPQEAVTKHAKVLLLGEPGGGKTTFINHFMLQMAEAQLQDQAPIIGWETLYWPFMIDGASLTTTLSSVDLTSLPPSEQDDLLVQLILKYWRNFLKKLGLADLGDHLEIILSEKPVLIVFDGFDEILAAKQPLAERMIQALGQVYPTIQKVIITCRARLFETSYLFPAFTPYQLLPLDQTKIERFILRWFGNHGHQKSFTTPSPSIQAKSDALILLLKDPDWRILMGNPLLLQTMVTLHHHNITLPKDRTELYDLSIGILLAHWQRHKGVIGSPRLQAVLDNYDQLRRIIERLAYEAMKNEISAAGNGCLSRSQVLMLLEQPAYLGTLTLADEFLDYLDRRTGLFIGNIDQSQPERPTHYQFTHPIFQTYLASCYLISGEAGSLQRVYWHHIQDGPEWFPAGKLGAETLLHNQQKPDEILDLLYTLCPVNEPIQEQYWRAILWSGTFALQVGEAVIRRDDSHPDGGGTYLTRLISRLTDIAARNILPVSERVEAGRILAQLGDPREAVVPTYTKNTPPLLEVCYVPSGPFWQGSDVDDDLAFSNEKPLQQVDLDYAYWISRFPVTVAQFWQFIEDGGYETAEHWSPARVEGLWDKGRIKRIKYRSGDDLTQVHEDWGARPDDYGYPFHLSNHPMVGINWYEATAYCSWLTTQLQDTGHLSKNWAIMLPSEAEWEKAARGGLDLPTRAIKTTLGREPLPDVDRFRWQLRLRKDAQRRFSWAGDISPNRLNYHDTRIGTTSAVGCFLTGASPYGCEDMNGNVWEWCRNTGGQNYKAAENHVGSGSTLNVQQVQPIRGGAFNDLTISVRCAVRCDNTAIHQSRSVGFRVVVVPKSDKAVY